MSNATKSSRGIGFAGILTIVFITLKLTGNIAWSTMLKDNSNNLEIDSLWDGQIVKIGSNQDSDVAFYKDDQSTAYLWGDATNGNIGIGTTSPNQ